MALQISEKNGVFYINGKIKTETVKSFIFHLDNIFKNDNRTVVINIDKVTLIDVDRVKAFKILKNKAQVSNINFEIIGLCNRDLNIHFDTNEYKVA